MKPVLDMLMILNSLSLCQERRLLSDTTFIQKKMKSHSARLETVFAYMNQNFNRQISLSEVASVVSMSDVAFSRFIKKVTGQSFVDTLTEIRLGHVARMLIDTDMTIAEIAYCCGFNNMANFNRISNARKACRLISSVSCSFRKRFTSDTVGPGNVPLRCYMHRIWLKTY